MLFSQRCGPRRHGPPPRMQARPEQAPVPGLLRGQKRADIPEVSPTALCACNHVMRAPFPNPEVIRCSSATGSSAVLTCSWCTRGAPHASSHQVSSAPDARRAWCHTVATSNAYLQQKKAVYSGQSSINYSMAVRGLVSAERVKARQALLEGRASPSVSHLRLCRCSQ